MHDNSNYNNKNQHFAHQLRQEMTKAEACLWKYEIEKNIEEFEGQDVGKI
jgi:very-short-patch-repair endonuclease